MWRVGLIRLMIGDFGTDRSLEAKHQPYYDYSRFNTQRLPAFHQLDVRVDKSFFFRKWSLIFYADIQNIYNYKALGPDDAGACRKSRPEASQRS